MEWLDKAIPKPFSSRSRAAAMCPASEGSSYFVVTVLLWKRKEGHLWQGWKMGSQIQESIKIYNEKIEAKAKS